MKYFIIPLSLLLLSCASQGSKSISKPDVSSLQNQEQVLSEGTAITSFEMWNGDRPKGGGFFDTRKTRVSTVSPGNGQIRAKTTYNRNDDSSLYEIKQKLDVELLAGHTYRLKADIVNMCVQLTLISDKSGVVEKPNIKS
jgi:hypothetical protein